MGVPQQRSNLRMSSGFSPRTVSQPSLETKKKLIFQFWREDGESRNNLELLSHGLNSQYPEILDRLKW